MTTTFIKAYCIKALVILVLAAACRHEKDAYQTWQVYKGDASSSSYSSLDQINRDNVDQLEVAWTYHSGDQRRAGSQSNPIMVEGVVYLTTPGIKVAALDAASGQVLWTFDPFEGEEPVSVNRGVTYWEDGGDHRIFFSAGSFLYALDAETGSLIEEFGDDGAVDLREGLGRDPVLLSVGSTSPGIIHDDFLIMGSIVGEGTGSAPGHIRAYNAKTGEMEWIFHTIPHPGEYGHETWGDNAWQQAGGTNNWAGMSLDKEREMVFVPTGAPAPDFYKPGTSGKGRHLFGNSVLALDANTGERIWHYQIIHHDLWDYDLPAPPNLVTVEKGGKRVDAVAQVTKHGFIFVLDRETGVPLFPVEERPVPQSEIEGEESWPTQPFPQKPKPFVRQQLGREDLTNISPEAREYALKRFEELNYEGMFTPVGEEETLFYPGTRGGAEWGGASYDPETGVLYINANEYGNTFALKRVKVPSRNTASPAVRGREIYQIHCASCHSSPGGPLPTQFPSLLNVKDKYTRHEVEEIMEKGRGGKMPAFPQLSDTEKKAIIEYLFSVDEKGNMKTAGAADPGAEEADSSYTYTTDFAYRSFLDQEGYPATKPPWGTMNAINLNTGELEWRVPLGEYEELTKRGVPVTGTPNMGGSIVTAGGLVFIGAAADEKFRAFDKETGDILWEYQLPAVGYATPSTYEIDGRQYVVIAATGGARAGVNKSDAFIAFSLPVN
ncbi:PQQ-binding-like beta-propeller repeat protein [Fodinibius sediminis]|uniref:Quinoprotein glucose dehydrogenase n=1 Tax=Fodinibius sediminis TaxID=1214077 RepID=A0A521DPX2_9BACT|nr:PQQ-binding-like beta-propeller repeat protein [Fodinibius sediminis]SMO73688.1 quinoprotein glucose dehydrogenase [Fodinibius sediminis]